MAGGEAIWRGLHRSYYKEGLLGIQMASYSYRLNSDPSSCFPSSLRYFWWHGKYFLPASFYETLSESGRRVTACTYLGFPDAWHALAYFLHQLSCLVLAAHPGTTFPCLVSSSFHPRRHCRTEGTEHAQATTASCLQGWNWNGGRVAAEMASLADTCCVMSLKPDSFQRLSHAA